MSISSMPGSDENGYRLTTTRSIGSMPWCSHVGDVLGIGRVGEDAAVDLRVQRHDPMTENRRESGEFSDVGDGHTRIRDGSGGSTTRHE